MAAHRGKVKEYIVGHGSASSVEFTGLNLGGDNPDRLKLPNSDSDRRYVHDCILVALANNLDVNVSFDDATRAINYVRVYPA